MSPVSRLQSLLERREFTVSAELGPPKGPNIEVITTKIGLLRGMCDAVNVTDNQTAIVRISSAATCALLVQQGIEPIMQMTCRDRNRLAIQADLFGAVALGVRNLLCLSGDHQVFGNHPTAKNVFDLDSVQMIGMVKRLRDEGLTLGGEPVDGAMPMFIGGAANPFGDPFELQVLRALKKANAGVQFIQTQCIYDMVRFREWMKRVTDLGIPEHVHILAGVMPLKSAGAARYINNNVAGIYVPDPIVKRMSAAGKGQKARDEGIRITAEIIEQVREIPGVHGVHIMAVEWEEAVQPLTEMAGLLPRPVLAEGE
ncbi:MAG: methylenetetrahydrofolate reductase [Chloroflexi bacterium]|mgnify:CR=1 FL=1|nr:methylenetetrahydrofolate reductase [Chloroflexota bacterium]